MDAEEFREFGKTMIDFIADYNITIRTRNVLPSVEPGYLSKMLPSEAPENGEKWQDIMQDIERVIMPGVTHWQSPNFHAYYPAAYSYPSIVGEILSAGLGVIGFSWIASPACTELEVVMMDWLGKLLGLPKAFLNSDSGPGGGVLQGSASEAMLVALLTARDRTIRRIKNVNPDWDENTIRSKLVAYSSDQSNSCVEKTGLLGAMTMRLLPADDKCCLRGEAVLNAIKQDVKNGFIPCYLVATLGTTGTCAFDNLNEIGVICKEYNVWLHIDAAYAGSAFLCPEYRHLMSGVDYADSFDFNPHKWLLTNFECSALWLKNAGDLVDTFNVDRIYLKTDNKGVLPEYRHWQISLGRRFRSLKLWFVLRTYGVTGLQNHIRNTIKLAKEFEQLVCQDERFEIGPESSMGLVCFRLKGNDSLSQQLVDRLTERKKIYVIQAIYKNKIWIRYSICSRLTTSEDNAFAWNEICSQVTELLNADSQKLNTKFINDIRVNKIIKDGDIKFKMENLRFDVRNMSSEKCVN